MHNGRTIGTTQALHQKPYDFLKDVESSPERREDVLGGSLKDVNGCSEEETCSLFEI